MWVKRWLESEGYVTIRSSTMIFILAGLGAFTAWTAISVFLLFHSKLEYDYSYDLGAYDITQSDVTYADQAGLRALVEELGKLPIESLFIAKVEKDICNRPNIIKCYGVDAERVQRYADLALTQRQIIEDRRIKEESNMMANTTTLISFGALVVSIIALLWSVIKDWRTFNRSI